MSLRIIGGAWRGRRLQVPEDAAIRPTSERAREALFSRLSARLGSLEGLAVADIFAGSGALGFEALSRGAALCTFIETAPAAHRSIAASAAALGAQDRVSLLTVPAAQAPVLSSPAHLMFLDPPYSHAFEPALLTGLAGKGWIDSATWISLEVPAGPERPVLRRRQRAQQRATDPLRQSLAAAGFIADSDDCYGAARLLLLRRTGAGKSGPA